MTVDFSAPFKQIEAMANLTLARLPVIFLALLTFFLFLAGARFLRNLVSRVFTRQGRRQNTALLLGRLTQGFTVFAGLIISVLVVFPSVKAQNIVELFGISSVAIGFAFRDILQNFLAGILVLINEPFTIGDRIHVKEFEGVVKDIQARATLLETPEGKIIVVPNATIFTEAVVVFPPAEVTAQSRPAAQASLLTN